MICPEGMSRGESWYQIEREEHHHRAGSEGRLRERARVWERIEGLCRGGTVEGGTIESAGVRRTQPLQLPEFCCCRRERVRTTPGSIWSTHWVPRRNWQHCSTASSTTLFNNIVQQHCSTKSSKSFDNIVRLHCLQQNCSTAPFDSTVRQHCSTTSFDNIVRRNRSTSFDEIVRQHRLATLFDSIVRQHCSKASFNSIFNKIVRQHSSTAPFDNIVQQHR